MSKIIAFPGSARSPGRAAGGVQEPASQLAASCAALLHEVIGDLEGALGMTRDLVNVMSDGKARELAREELAKLYGQLELARTLSREIAMQDGKLHPKR